MDGTRIALHFEGKSAVEQQTEVRDALLARRLSTLIDESTDGMLFVDSDDRPITAGQVNEYIGMHSGSDMSAKDLRTWGATCAAADRLVRADGDDIDATVRVAIEHAADRLGNTVAVCRSSYIAPRVLSAFETGELHGGVAALAAGEVAEPCRADCPSCRARLTPDLPTRRSGEPVRRLANRAQRVPPCR